MRNMNQIKIVSINNSKFRNTPDNVLNQIHLSVRRISNKKDSGSFYNQISLLDRDSYDRFYENTGRRIAFGDFGETITTEGTGQHSLLPLDRLRGNEVEIELTNTAKHYQSKDCTNKEEIGGTFSVERLFARVTKPGMLLTGEILTYIPKVFEILIVSLSDRASRGDYKDRSGPLVTQIISDYFLNSRRTINIESSLIPDDIQQLRNLIDRGVKNSIDIIITTGGTGVGMRDITVDTIKPMLTKEIPGIMELIRIKYGSKKPNALLSRSVAGFIDNSLVYTLPGSVKAVNEYMEEILKTLNHLIYMRHGLDTH